MKKIFISALEPSANIHLHEVLKNLSCEDNITISGIYDQSFAEEFGFVEEPLYDIKDFAVMGFIDVFKKIIFLKKAMHFAAEKALENHVVLLLDSSSFHIPLGKSIKKANKDIFLMYYILPQVWAWKEYRKHILLNVFDKLCGILPFEESFYNSPKMSFVGHPLLDEIPAFKFSVTPLDSTLPIVFMPGSRKSEIKRLMPFFTQVALKLQQNEKDTEQILIIPAFLRDLSKDQLYEIYGKDMDLFTLTSEVDATLLRAKFAFVCSGTATLQAALIGTPLVLAYKTRFIEYVILKNIIKLNFIGLANIFFNAIKSNSPKVGLEKLHVELIQNDVSVENLLQEYRNMNEGEFFSRAQGLRKYLKNGSSKNIAEILKN